MSDVLSDREAVIFYAEQRGYASAMEAERKLHEAHIEAQAAEIERLAKDKRWIIDERDRTFALMLSRAEKAEAEVERLRGDLERGMSVAKDIEKACRGLRDAAQPMTAKDATRLIIAALTGDKND